MSGLEILGGLAATEQFVEVLFKAIRLIKSVVDQVQDAPDKVQQQTGRLESLNALTEQIQNTKALQTEDIGKILSRCERHVQSLHRLLQELSFQKQDSIGRKTWRAICSLKEEENVLKLFDQLDQDYNSLNIHIGLRMLAMTEGLQAGVQSIENKIRTMAQTADPTPDSLKCLQDLFITDPAMDCAKLITSKGELVLGTCDWIAQREEFLDWRASNGGVLWISGGPGLGKTMLSIYLTDYLSTCFRSLHDSESCYSTYFFCDAKDNTRNNAAAILRGLLFQLLEQDKQLITHILPKYEVQKQQLFGQNSLEALWDFFVQMVNGLGDSQVTCVLDGLDECEPVSLEPLLTKINKTSSTAPKLRMIILSREYPQCLGASLSQFLRIRLDPDAKAEVSDGLEQYISTRVAKLAESRHYPAELAVHVKETLREKSAGTYLWVSFVIKDLQTMGLSEVEERLKQFPRGLDALYDRILEQVEPSHRNGTLDILRWCAFAVRPLSLEELASALGIQSSELLDRVTILRGKLAYCGHFLSVANGVVTLVHQSAYDFLTSPVSDSRAMPWFSLSEVELEQSKLASTCISYMHLQKGRFEKATVRFEDYSREILQNWKYQDPFLHYAGHEWDNHFKHSGKHGRKILDENPYFFSGKSEVWKAWNDWRIGEGNPGPALVAADLGLPILMQRIVKDKGLWLYLKDTYARFTISGTLLHIAAERGHAPVAELLVKNKARIDVNNGEGETPLYLAARNGHLSVVKVLVENGADVEKGHDRDTPLRVAVKRGYYEIARFLLTSGANVDGKDKRWNPLAAAVSWRQPRMVRLLLDWGADTDTSTGDGWLSRLNWALYREPETLGMFLEFWAEQFCTAPAQFQAKVDFGFSTALHAACRAGDLSSIRLLLDPKWDLDLNWQDEDKNTPLHIAAQEGKVEAVELLLTQRSVDRTLVNFWGHSPLHKAIIYDRKKVVQCMVNDWNMPLPQPDPNCGWSAIHLPLLNQNSFPLSDTRDLQIFNRIPVVFFSGRPGVDLYHGAIRRESRTGEEPVETLSFLVEHLGLDPQSRTPKAKHPDDQWHSHHFVAWRFATAASSPEDFCHETPLSIAVRGGDIKAMEFFLSRCSIDPNASCRGCDGAIPLHVAAQSLRKDVVNSLLSNWKADVNAVDRRRRTPLHVVVSSVKLPSTRKKDICRDFSYRGKLDARDTIVQLLLAAGAQISARDVHGHTPRDLFISNESSLGVRGRISRGREFDRLIDASHRLTLSS